MGGISYREKPDKERYVIELVKSSNAHGVPFYAYLLLRRKELPCLLAALEAEEVDLNTHGNIIASGKGHHPPEAVQKLIESVFSDNL